MLRANFRVATLTRDGLRPANTFSSPDRQAFGTRSGRITVQCRLHSDFLQPVGIAGHPLRSRFEAAQTAADRRGCKRTDQE